MLSVVTTSLLLNCRRSWRAIVAVQLIVFVSMVLFWLYPVSLKMWLLLIFLGEWASWGIYRYCPQFYIQGQQIGYHGKTYRLGRRSKAGPGFCLLELTDESVHYYRVVVADMISETDFRKLCFFARCS